MSRRIKWEHLLGLLGVVMMIGSHYAGLFVAPPDHVSGDLGRIFYVYVPVTILSWVVFSISGLAAFGYLMTGRIALDWLVGATVEVGIMVSTLLLVLGAVWSRPTWGVWWTWEPRLTISTVLLITFVGVWLLRGATTNPEQRARWSSVAVLSALANVPLTYLAVMWRYRIACRLGSESPEVASWPVCHENLVAMILVLTWFIAWRWRTARADARANAPGPLPKKLR